MEAAKAGIALEALEDLGIDDVNDETVREHAEEILQLRLWASAT
jgi:hypothetical protein